MPPLRILHVTPYSAEAWAYGGIPRVAGALTNALARLGHSVTVCATDACTADRRLRAAGNGQAADERQASGRGRRTAGDGLRAAGEIDLRIFPNVSNRLAYHAQLFLPRGLRGYLRAHAHEFDVAHIHACRNVPGVLAARALISAGVPYVLAPNGTAPILERRRLAKRVFDAVAGQSVVDRAARVLAVSAAERRQLSDIGVHLDRIRQIANPVDLDEFERARPRGEFRRDLGMGDAPLVLFLGKITPRKRVDTLVRAFAALPRGDARLVIAGNDMGGLDAVRSLARALRVDGRLTCTGLLAGHTRLAALGDADVVVYASEDEVFGLVPLESLLCGSPVIVGDDSGCAEVISALGGQQVVTPGDSGALARAIAAVLDAPARARTAAAEAGQQVRSRFGSDVVAAELADVYREILGQPRAA